MSAAAHLVDGSAVPPGNGRPHPNTARDALWRHIFGDERGLIAAFSGKRLVGEQELRDETSRYFEWPAQSLAASRWLQDQSDHGRDAYACAHLVTKRRRVKANAAPMWALYVDGDGASVPSTLPRPTLTVESSPGREQCYWRLTRPVAPAVGEQLNKRLAKAIGADMSGWDLTQLLRPPGTRNWKYAGGPEVRVLSIEDRAYDPDELDRILPPLPEATTPKAEPKPAGRVTGDAAAILTRMLDGKRGAELGDLYHRGAGTENPSSADLSFQNAAAFYSDRDPAIMDQLHRASALMRDKWDEVHFADGRTYGQATIAKAIADCHTSIGDLVAKPPAPSAPKPSDEGNDELGTLRAEVERLRAEDRRLRGVIDNLADVVHVQHMRIQGLIVELNQERELRARDRRLMLAEQRLDRCRTFNAGQKAAIKAVARIAPALANSHQTDEPILTREMVAGVYGAKEDTAGGHLKVFDLEGSPVPRVRRPYGTKELTHYKLETRDPVEIVDRMAALGERLEKRPSPRQRVQCRTCPEGTGTIVTIVCEGCGQLLDERHVAAPKGATAPNAGKNPPLGSNPRATVDVPVTLRAEKPAVVDGLDEVTLARRAREAVEIPTRAPDHRKRPDVPEPEPGHLMRESLGAPVLTRSEPASEPPTRCRLCPSLELYQLADGRWRCEGCGEVAS